MELYPPGKHRPVVDSFSLYEKFPGYLTAHIGQAEITTLMPVSELCVIEPKPIEDRRLKIMNMYFVFGDVETDIVGLTDGLASFDSSASQPHAERKRMVIASFIARLAGSSHLHHRRPPKFSTPDHECIFEQPALLQIAKKRRGWLIRCVAVFSSALYLTPEWWSQLACITWTNRTPRSTIRRASRQFTA